MRSTGLLLLVAISIKLDVAFTVHLGETTSISKTSIAPGKAVAGQTSPKPTKRRRVKKSPSLMSKVGKAALMAAIL